MVERILFVDDDKDVLELGINLLRDAGYMPTHAINSDVAVIILSQGVPFDVLITDLVLPGMRDGFALAHRARELHPNIRVIYSTGFPYVARVRSRGSVLGEVLAKPWRGADLLRVLERHPQHASAGR
jgi:DNA-binding NtrC family response regulator